MDLCNESRSSGWPANCYTQTVQPNFFISAMLICTIDFYHFVPLSLTLTFRRGHLIRMKFDVVMKQF